jgi:hypothetical protein
MVPGEASRAQLAGWSVVWSSRSDSTDGLPITSRILRVGLDGSRRIWPAHVGRVVDPDGDEGRHVAVVPPAKCRHRLLQ